MKSLYEQLGGTYHEGEDGLLYLDLLLPEEDVPTYGKYDRLRRTYLKEYHEGLFTSSRGNLCLISQRMAQSIYNYSPSKCST